MNRINATIEGLTHRWGDVCHRLWEFSEGRELAYNRRAQIYSGYASGRYAKAKTVFAEASRRHHIASRLFEGVIGAGLLTARATVEVAFWSATATSARVSAFVARRVVGGLALTGDVIGLGARTVAIYTSNTIAWSLHRTFNGLRRTFNIARSMPSATSSIVLGADAQPAAKVAEVSTRAIEIPGRVMRGARDVAGVAAREARDLGDHFAKTAPAPAPVAERTKAAVAQRAASIKKSAPKVSVPKTIKSKSAKTTGEKTL